MTKLVSPHFQNTHKLYTLRETERAVKTQSEFRTCAVWEQRFGLAAAFPAAAEVKGNTRGKPADV